MSIFRIKDPDSVFLEVPYTMDLVGAQLLGESFERPYFGIWREEWNELFKFAFIRHPISRFISCYLDYASRETRQTMQPFPLDQFAKQAIFAPNERLWQQLLPMSNALHALDKADYIGRFEIYYQDLDSLMVHLGITKGDEIPIPREDNWKNIVKQQMSPDVYESVVDYYRQDFNEYNYEVLSYADL